MKTSSAERDDSIALILRRGIQHHAHGFTIASILRNRVPDRRMVQPTLPPLSPSPGSSAPSSPSRRGSPTSSSPPKADEALPKIGGYPTEAAAAPPPPPPPPLALVPVPPPPGEAEDGGDATGGEAEEAKEVGKAAPLRGLDLLRRMSKKIPVVLYADWKAGENARSDHRCPLLQVALILS